MSFLRALQREQLCQRCRTRLYATNIPPGGTTTVPSKPKKAQASAAAPIPRSSCPTDTVLDGVNYLKGQQPVLALADDHYPDWLWTILKPKEYADDGPGGKAERVQRRLENKKRIKDRNFMSTQ